MAQLPSCLSPSSCPTPPSRLVLVLPAETPSRCRAGLSTLAPTNHPRHRAVQGRCTSSPPTSGSDSGALTPSPATWPSLGRQLPAGLLYTWCPLTPRRGHATMMSYTNAQPSPPPVPVMVITPVNPPQVPGPKPKPPPRHLQQHRDRPSSPTPSSSDNGDSDSDYECAACTTKYANTSTACPV